jgi:hypothetical protein
MATQTLVWCLVYLVFPCIPICLEWAAKVIFGVGFVDGLDAFPYVSMIVAIMAVAIFIRDELGKYRIPDPDSDEIEGLRAFRDSMFWFFGIGGFCIGVLVACESLVTIQKMQRFEVPLNYIRISSIVMGFAFCITVIRAQQRYHLRAAI